MIEMDKLTTQAGCLIEGLTILARYDPDIELVASPDCLYFHFTNGTCGNDMAKADYERLVNLDFWRESTEHLHCFEFFC